MTAALNIAAFRRSLLAWYRRSYRPLPWRPRPRKNSCDDARQANPYHVLVSEFMLQQTQVATVVPYFRRFVRTFPTVAALARADEQHVLLLWQGLGYYRRATNLHRAAQTIMRDHGGKVPNTVVGLLSLPGVGRYTAGAIASIAFGRRAAAVDGNVARVLSRLAGMTDRRRTWELAENLVPRTAPADFNQALMDLGATLCLPRRPRCRACPVRGYCVAQGAAKRGCGMRKATPHSVTHHLLALRCGSKYLFQQRPARGLWAKLWQMPTVELDGQGLLSPAALGRRFTAILGVAVRRPKRFGEFVHLTSHRRITFVLWLAHAPRPCPRLGRWRFLEDLADLPMSAAQRRVLRLLASPAISFSYLNKNY